jgi:hypothetical protein
MRRYEKRAPLPSKKQKNVYISLLINILITIYYMLKHLSGSNYLNDSNNPAGSVVIQFPVVHDHTFPASCRMIENQN